MGTFYDKHILPRITHFVCGSGPVMKQRLKVIPHAEGRVLEIGAGSGLNFEFYDNRKVDHLFALEPSEDMWSLAKKAVQPGMSIDFVKGFAEDIPLGDNEVDTIVMTYTLCSLAWIQESFAEMRRVLKPSGKLIFCEHGKAPDASVVRWQNILNTPWKMLGGGCHLNRDIPVLIEKGAFSISEMNTMYIPGFKPASFNYWGIAKPMR